jgi:hypothetical protein
LCNRDAEQALKNGLTIGVPLARADRRAAIANSRCLKAAFPLQISDDTRRLWRAPALGAEKVERISGGNLWH